jgi:hypothetical protein
MSQMGLADLVASWRRLWENAMAIRNETAYTNSFWDWSGYDSCFGRTGIKISDIDGIVERKGWFLLIETKYPGAEIPTGQRRLHDALIANGRFTVMVIWGEKNNPRDVLIRQSDGVETRRKTSTEDIHRAIARWFEYADTGKWERGGKNGN